MIRTMLSGKIHRARVTGADVDYVGSITLDPLLMEAAGILPHEQVHVVDVDNGARLVTYAIPGTRGSGAVQLNGAAAHLVEVGDLVIIMAYVTLDDAEAEQWRPRVAFVDDENRVVDRDTAVRAGRYVDGVPVEDPVPV